MKIMKFLPEHEEPVLVQGRVVESIYRRVDAERKRLDLSWPELLTAMFRAFLEEVK